MSSRPGAPTAMLDIQRSASPFQRHVDEPTVGGGFHTLSDRDLQVACPPQPRRGAAWTGAKWVFGLWARFDDLDSERRVFVPFGPSDAILVHELHDQRGCARADGLLWIPHIP